LHCLFALCSGEFQLGRAAGHDQRQLPALRLCGQGLQAVAGNSDRGRRRRPLQPVGRAGVTRRPRHPSAAAASGAGAVAAAQQVHAAACRSADAHRGRAALHVPTGGGRAAPPSQLPLHSAPAAQNAQVRPRPAAPVLFRGARWPF